MDPVINCSYTFISVEKLDLLSIFIIKRGLLTIVNRPNDYYKWGAIVLLMSQS